MAGRIEITIELDTDLDDEEMANVIGLIEAAAENAAAMESAGVNAFSAEVMD